MIQEPKPFFASQYVNERKLSNPSLYTFAHYYESKLDTNSMKHEDIEGVSLPLNEMSVAADVQSNSNKSKTWANHFQMNQKEQRSFSVAD